ncbi:hypothetical protein KC357_g56 [Hortaea werneckii]|nr:hypothetical protein KC357_g56 [Hortaea werneckii]
MVAEEAAVGFRDVAVGYRWEATGCYFFFIWGECRMFQQQFRLTYEQYTDWEHVHVDESDHRWPPYHGLNANGRFILVLSVVHVTIGYSLRVFESMGQDRLQGRLYSMASRHVHRTDRCRPRPPKDCAGVLARHAVTGRLRLVSQAALQPRKAGFVRIATSATRDTADALRGDS